MKENKILVDQKINSITHGKGLDNRTLRSLGVHFRLDLNLLKGDDNDLRYAVHEWFENNIKSLEDIYVREIIKADKLDYESFKFLGKYSEIYVHHLLRWFNIADENVLLEAFKRKAPIILTVGYIFDVQRFPPRALKNILKPISEKLMTMDKLADRANWFDAAAKREAAEYIFFRRGRVNCWRAFSEHPEIFFLDDKINFHEKEALFKDIRARYNLEMSRQVNPKKQCNFSIDPKAYELMEKIRKKSGFKKSVFLEIIFSPENEEILHKLVKLKTMPPVLHKPTEFGDLDFSKIVVPLGGYK